MRVSPFAFYRGNAAIMAADLAGIPTTGLRVQACGDAHLLNFGAFATPERRLVFDVEDFDETLMGPWEWDILRLCASLPLACEAHGIARRYGDEAIGAVVRTYRDAMRVYARMAPLDVWYARVDVKALLRSELTFAPSAEQIVPKLTVNERGTLRFVDRPPLFTRISDADRHAAIAHGVLRTYRASLPLHVRALLDRYHLVDLAMKIVGIGSVGTLCLVALFTAEDDQPLLLQLKEAQASVLEEHLAKSPFATHGERVVAGAHMMQAATDLFLGWTSEGGRDFYVRQLRDMKASIDLEQIAPAQLVDYAAHCGATLARAHARSGEPGAIAAYLGRSDRFVTAVGRFAHAYAKQTQRDYDAFVRATAG